jgi:hypothetical protein
VTWAVAVHICNPRHMRLKCFKIKHLALVRSVASNLFRSPRIHSLFFASPLVMDILCSKCRSIFSTPIKGKLASQYDRMPLETLARHGESIASLSLRRACYAIYASSFGKQSLTTLKFCYRQKAICKFAMIGGGLK